MITIQIKNCKILLKQIDTKILIRDTKLFFFTFTLQIHSVVPKNIEHVNTLFCCERSK